MNQLHPASDSQGVGDQPGGVRRRVSRGIFAFDLIPMYYRMSEAIYRAGLGEENLHAGLFYQGTETTAEATHNLNKYFVGKAAASLPQVGKAPIFCDLGCGRGGLAAEAVKQGFSVMAVNVSPEQLAAAEKLARANGTIVFDGTNADAAQIRFYLADAQSFAIGQKASVVAFCESIVHMDRQRALSNAYELLAPGGLLQLTDSDFEMRSLTDRLTKAAVELGFLSKFYSRENYREQLDKIGFVDIEIVSLDDLVRPLFEKMCEQLQTKEGLAILTTQYGSRGAHFIASQFGRIIPMFKNKYGYYYVQARKPSAARCPV